MALAAGDNWGRMRSSDRSVREGWGKCIAPTIHVRAAKSPSKSRPNGLPTGSIVKCARSRRFVAYAVPNEGKLRKVDIAGGAPQTITETGRTPMVGGAWTRDTDGNGVIIFSQLRFSSQLSGSPGIQHVSEGGGTPTPLTTLVTGEAFHIGTQFLPDGHHFLYLRWR